ncbi:hypothetical protein F3Y22_tig00110556pilonHSYRG00607 [Hibiscus syriacus]|uniref:Uncharacterized protein n=1 Tax=Hibiscus syriacus TaxID=106335 RepID=A0A6A3A9V2_HIBSY|nr:hypothetical protein F3Y22_tig00110556pilonHSYRG00607 [Hibiscus syriacus]
MRGSEQFRAPTSSSQSDFRLKFEIFSSDFSITVSVMGSSAAGVATLRKSSPVLRMESSFLKVEFSV